MADVPSTIYFNFTMLRSGLRFIILWSWIFFIGDCHVDDFPSVSELSLNVEAQVNTSFKEQSFLREIFKEILDSI